MKRNLALGILLCAFTGCAIHYADKAWNSPRLFVEASERDGQLEGDWHSNSDAFGGSPFSRGTWVSIEVTDKAAEHKIILGRPVEEIDGLLPILKEGPPVATFQIRGEAGEMSFDGEQKGGIYEGRFQFVPQAAFETEARRALAPAPSNMELMEFCLLGVDREYLQLIGEGAERFVSPREVISLRRAGVTTAYAKGMRAAGVVKAEDMVRLRHSGVQPEMVESLRRAGFAFAPEHIVRLRNAGVTADYAAGWKRAGFEFSADDIVRLRNSGVPLEFASALKASGADWSAEDITRLRNAGVQPDYIRDLRAASPSIAQEDIVRLRHAGVTADYFAAWRQYRFSPEDIVRLRNSGVPATWAEDLMVPGRTPLSAQAIVHLRNRGISPEVARELRQ